MDFRHFVTNQPIILTNWGKIKTKSPLPNLTATTQNLKFMSRNQKKCNRALQVLEKQRIFASQEG